jgi:hypothetical protein
MTLRFTAKGENIKSFVYLKHGQMSIKCIFVLNCLFWSLIIQRVQNAEIGISHHSMDSHMRITLVLNFSSNRLEFTERGEI